MTKLISADQPCPCGTGSLYSACCEPLHQGRSHATTAEQLMRSRYCAWAAGLIDYLLDTTWIKQRAGLKRKEMQEWADRTHWLSLEIVDTSAGLDHDNQGEVEFCARFQLPPVEEVKEHRERSQFVRDSGHWFFVDPTIPVRTDKSVGRNDPCPCGSGKKFKKCCG